MDEVRRTLPDEAYFAVNLRADGPIPGLCSLQVLELTLVGESRAGRIEALPIQQRQRFSIEMRPLGRPFESAGQNWLATESMRLALSGVPVGEAMVAASGWVRNLTGSRTAVPITWPGGIEGVHLHHYFTWRGDGSTPFSTSRVANNVQLVSNLLGDDQSLIAGIRTHSMADASVLADAPSRAGALTTAVNLLSVFR